MSEDKKQLQIRFEKLCGTRKYSTRLTVLILAIVVMTAAGVAIAFATVDGRTMETEQMMLQDTEEVNEEQNVNEQNTEAGTNPEHPLAGIWYECRDNNADGELVIWEIKENGQYIWWSEQEFQQPRHENFQPYIKFYRIEDGMFLTNSALDRYKIHYSDYGVYLENINIEEKKSYQLYKKRQDAVESSAAYLTSDFYYEQIRDENGCAVVEGELRRYYTDEKNIRIPDYVSSVGCKALKGKFISEGLKTVTIPGTVKKIGIGAFGEIIAKKVVIEEGVQEVCGAAFMGAYIDEIYYPASVTKIMNNAHEPYGDGDISDEVIYVKEGSYAQKFFESEYKNYGRKVKTY